MRRLLIANRGEIAVRIARTAHSMGIETVAVFTASDADAPHVASATLARRLPAGGHLDADALLDVARACGADAVHPGYGFLSEDAVFARAVVDAGLAWVGPSPEVIASLGDKVAAKTLAIESDVPTLPMYADPHADELSFPVMIKAAAGGGGKGMRIVASADGLAEALAAASREATAAFGDGAVFIERYVGAARHIEIQILGDEHGTLIHLGERECSIQRRHQKIIEESPSPRVDVDLRAAMGSAAIRLAAAAGYTSAGTVEFLVDDVTGEFWFLEVNTRLQVEHPVTEAVTGIDLVRQQLRIAQGLPIDCIADRPQGHAIEARLCAEDPTTGFLPAVGTLVAFDIAAEPAVRVDSSVRAGSSVGIEFDPMLAKVTAHAPTRAEAAGALALALDRMQLAGVVTNRRYLAGVLRSPEFLAGATTTAFVGSVPIDVALTVQRVRNAAIAAALHRHRRNESARTSLPTIRSGLRTGRLPWPFAEFEIEGSTVVVRWDERRDGTFGVEVAVDDESSAHLVEIGEVDTVGTWLQIDADRARFRVAHDDDTTYVHDGQGDVAVASIARFRLPTDDRPDGGLVAPMPGKVLDVRAAVGDLVDAGSVVVILEAMKMEHHLTAPSDGEVIEVPVRAGDQVDNGAVLMVIDSPGG